MIIWSQKEKCKRDTSSTTLKLVSAHVSSDESLWSNITHSCEHGDSSVLELCLTTSLEVLNAAVRGKTGRVPEAHWCLDTKLVLKGSEDYLRRAAHQARTMLTCQHRSGACLFPCRSGATVYLETPNLRSPGQFLLCGQGGCLHVRRKSGDGALSCFFSME